MKGKTSTPHRPSLRLSAHGCEPVGAEQVRLTVVIDNPSEVPIGILLPTHDVEPEHEEYEFEGMFDSIEGATGLVAIASTSCNTGPTWNEETAVLAPGERVIRSVVTHPQPMLSWSWTQFMAGQPSVMWTERACVHMKIADGSYCSLYGGSEGLCESRTLNIDVASTDAVGY